MDRSSDVLESIDAQAVAERAAKCRSVARLSGGQFGEVATYLPGRRVRGVRLGEGHVEVHVVACWGARVADVAAEVRAAVSPMVAGLPIDVHVDDVDLPDGGEGAEIFLPDDG